MAGSRSPSSPRTPLLALAWLTSDALDLAGSVRGAALADVVRDLALVALPVLYVLGFVAQRPSRAHVADLLLAARDEQEPNRLRDLVARAIGDPRTTVGWWDARTEGYLDHRGREVAVPDGGALEVEAGGRPIAVVLSDHLAEVDPGVRESVAEALLLAAENRRLTAELQVSLEQVRDSRSRILSASDDTRRQIERDLHDGAQQLMISTGIKLNLAVAHAERGETELLGVLEEAASELNRALAELRNLAGGIAPAALVHGSLTNALQEVALRSAVPTTVRVVGAEQPDERLAATVYFVVAECLANVAKHANASAAAVDVRLEDPVRVTVTDNGRGGATLESAGTGLRGLSDRVEARGGQLDVSSGDDGTTVTATIPLGVLQESPAMTVDRPCVIVVDDAVLIREGVRQLLLAGGCDVVATASDVDGLFEALAAAPQADALVLDIRMPPDHSDEGMRALERLRAEGSALGILLLSMYASPTLAVRALSAGGATGYLLKERITDGKALVAAVRTVVSGGTVVDPDVVSLLLGSTARSRLVDALTPREREVLQLMGEGRSNLGIAELLHLSVKTVETHVEHILDKLGIEPSPGEHRRVLAVLELLRAGN